METTNLRNKLVEIALEWEKIFSVAPSITSTISEFDAAILVGHSCESYARDCMKRTAVTKGVDFSFNNQRYQIKANRPSGKPGSKVTLVAKAKNYDWDFLIWILYDKFYNKEEAWMWHVEDYKKRFADISRMSPKDMRLGTPLL